MRLLILILLIYNIRFLLYTFFGLFLFEQGNVNIDIKVMGALLFFNNPKQPLQQCCW